VDVSIGARIKAARTAAGMTQMDVARRTDLSLQAVGDIERGIVRDPHISSLRQIAYALGVPVEMLVKEEMAVPAFPLDEAPDTGRSALEITWDAAENAQALVEDLTRRLARLREGKGSSEYDEILIDRTRLTPALLRSVITAMEDNEDRLDDLVVIIEGGYVFAGLSEGSSLTWEQILNDYLEASLKKARERARQ